MNSFTTPTRPEDRRALRERGGHRPASPGGDRRLGGEPPSTSASLPERSLEQRLAALKTANDIRSHRAQLKKDLKSGAAAPDAGLDDPKCDTMKILDYLLALPKIGRVKALRYLGRNQISPSKTLGGLSPRQRLEVERFIVAYSGDRR